MAADLSAATRAEILALQSALSKAEIAIRDVASGSGSPAAPGRFTEAQANTLIDAVTTAITGVS